mmetsp:Transcript_373/g.1312  ORF Transcript_373/g.1312 Transcript_373/m.1312 type:complete len:218 (-) Transcript_373:1019-1672(-)
MSSVCSLSRGHHLVEQASSGSAPSKRWSAVRWSALRRSAFRRSEGIRAAGGSGPPPRPVRSCDAPGSSRDSGGRPLGASLGDDTSAECLGVEWESAFSKRLAAGSTGLAGAPPGRSGLPPGRSGFGRSGFPPPPVISGSPSSDVGAASRYLDSRGFFDALARCSGFASSRCAPSPRRWSSSRRAPSPRRCSSRRCNCACALCGRGLRTTVGLERPKP